MELFGWVVDFFHWFVDIVLHLDAHLVELLRDYGFWVYLILFTIIFAETGLVVTPFLPGDSLLFAAGALAAVDTSNTLSAPLLSLVLVIAAGLSSRFTWALTLSATSPLLVRPA